MLAYAKNMGGDTVSAVADLRYSWDGAYIFGWSAARGEFTARRADNGQLLHSVTAGGLRAIVRHDYAASPVVKPSAALDAALGRSKGAR